MRAALPRPLHPFAWWLWAIALAVGTNSTTNPFLLIGTIAVACLVTVSRRGDNPWAKGFIAYLILGAFIVIVRIGFRVLFGGGDGDTIVLRLPEIPLPWWVTGIRLLGPVSLESILAGAYDGLRLATMIVCLGAANSLANPKRLLASLPGALYEAGTVLVVAVSSFPQLGESFLRVRRARRVRPPAPTGNPRRDRFRVVETLIVPVLSDALDRSVRLAASMDVRGFGRSGMATMAQRRTTTGLGLAGVCVLTFGSYVALSGTRLLSSVGPGLLAALVMVVGAALVAWAMHRSGRTVQRTTYRPIRWTWAEWLAVACGVAYPVIIWFVAASQDKLVLAPSVLPLEWPRLTLPLLAALVLAAVPAFATPPPSLAASRSPDHQEGLS